MKPSLAARLLLGPIEIYRRFVSPALPASCRYYPTCSAYAAEALQVHGAGRGSWLAVRRLGRCHPWHRGGLDPVPPRRERFDPLASSSAGTVPPFSSVTDRACAGPVPAGGRSSTPDSGSTDARPATAQAPNPRSNAA